MFCKVAAVAAVLLAAAGVRAAGPGTVHYLGTINGNLGVAATLTTGEKGEVNGTYMYARYGKDLFLKGKQGEKGMVLAETNRNMAQTGAFVLAARDGGVAGTWKSPDGKKVLPVTLWAVGETVKLSVGKTGFYTVETGYLRLGGKTDFYRELNKVLEEEATGRHEAAVKEMKEMTADVKAGDNVMPYDAEEIPEVTYAGEELVSVRTMLVSYSGGAHNNYGYAISNYGWRGGKVVKLETGDLVNVTDAGMKALGEMCRKDLKAQGASWPEQLKFEAKSPPDVNVTSEGLLVTFSPYEVGSFADGTYVVALGWGRLKGMVGEGSWVKGMVK